MSTPLALVTGINRSGTSAVANLLSLATNQTLLDDPEWAIESADGPLAYRRHLAYRYALESVGVVKCPRMCEVLGEFLSDFPYTNAVCLIRDPRDIWCSILEKVQLGRPTRMLNTERFGTSTNVTDGFIRQVKHCYTEMTRAHSRFPGRVTFLRYELLFAKPETSIMWLASELGLPVVNPLAASALATQWGPVGHKLDPQRIVGAGRWRSELPTGDAARLTEELLGQFYALVRLTNDPHYD